MEPKKSPKVNLEKRKFGYFQIGLVVALCAVLAAFEWRTFDKEAIAGTEIEFEMLEFDIPPVLMQPAPSEAPRTVNNALPPVVDPNPPTPPTPTPPNPNPNPNPDPDIRVLDLDGPATYTAPEKDIFVIVEDMPEFVGGMEALVEYLEENLNYPGIAIEQGIQGTVGVEFLVSKDGSISEIRLKDDYDIGGGCGKEAMRVVENMPNWIPGKQRGEVVNVRFTLPITFKLKQ